MADFKRIRSMMGNSGSGVTKLPKAGQEHYEPKYSASSSDVVKDPKKTTGKKLETASYSQGMKRRASIPGEQTIPFQEDIPSGVVEGPRRDLDSQILDLEQKIIALKRLKAAPKGSPISDSQLQVQR